MTRGNLLGRDPSGTRSVLAWTVRGAWSNVAGACRVLRAEAKFRHRGQPRHHACTCPLNRQGTAAAALPHACFSKDCSSTASCTPLQHLWGSKAHTHIHTCTHTHTHAHAHTHTHAQTHRHTRVCTHTCARIHECTYTHTHMHMHAHQGCPVRACVKSPGSQTFTLFNEP
jgi:hypothetical protein